MIKFLVAAAAAAAAPAMLVASFSSPMNDYNLSYDDAERSLVFARSEAEFQKARIFYSERNGLGWTRPAPISFTDERYSDTDPWLTPDGKTLYFISTRPTAAEPAKKDLDIWRSRKVGRNWSAPEHLGDVVNSPGPELGVEFHRGILYFASARKGGRGGLDIYSARLGLAGFEPPQPISGPFNTKESDSDFTLSGGGGMAAFWRGNGVIHIAYRQSQGWTAPIPLPGSINMGPFNFTPSFTRDGKRLRFASTVKREGQAEGMADIYVAKLPPAPK
nr:hypothetical protein [uncultured Sphingosinicella sp.]